MSTECIQEPRFIATCDRCPSKCQSWATSRIKAEKVAVQDYGWEMRGMEALCPRCAAMSEEKPGYEHVEAWEPSK